MASQVGLFTLGNAPNTNAIISALEIDRLYAPERLGKLIQYLGATPAVGNLRGNADIFSSFYTLFDGLVWLSRASATATKLLETEKLASVTPDNPVLELRLLDFENEGIEAERVRLFFDSISEIHTHLSVLLKVQNSRLRIAYVDSGSDFIVGLQCAKAILDILRP